MKYSIYQITKNEEKLSLFHCESFLDIIDVVCRVKNKYGETDYPIYLGDIFI